MDVAGEIAGRIIVSGDVGWGDGGRGCLGGGMKGGGGKGVS